MIPETLNVIIFEDTGEIVLESGERTYPIFDISLEELVSDLPDPLFVPCIVDKRSRKERLDN